MTGRPNLKALGKSIFRMLKTADATIEQPGASIVTQRLIDYSSGEFAKLTLAEALELLRLMDRGWRKRLYRDALGKVIGYAYSARIFVSLRDNQQKEDEQRAPSGPDAPPAFDPDGHLASAPPQGEGPPSGGAPLATSPSPPTPKKRHSDMDFAKQYAGKFMAPAADDKSAKKKGKKKDASPAETGAAGGMGMGAGAGAGGGGDFAGQYAGGFAAGAPGAGGDDKKKKKKGAAAEPAPTDFAKQYAGAFMGGGAAAAEEPEKKKKKKKKDDDKKKDKKKDEKKKSDKKDDKKKDSKKKSEKKKDDKKKDKKK